MRYLSVCSGIEAASVAWHDLGWTPVALSEIERFPSALLAHHYPTVPNWGDMTRFLEWPDAAVDVLVGGTPCQSFSVAGLRKGMDDPRGNLALTYLAIAHRYRPKWLVWENVPGVLSSNGGRNFGSLLGGLGQLGYGFAYRVLDAQYFGVAQRRRRVFVVANARGWQRAASVLFERHSLSGNPPPSKEAGEASATLTSPRPGGDGSYRLDAHDVDGGFVQTPVLSFHNRQDPDVSGSITHPLGAKDNGMAAMVSMQVRRLTPRECERLQGFPDDYTLIPHRGKPAADGPRYKALGNSMAVPVMRWIGQRIAAVDTLK